MKIFFICLIMSFHSYANDSQLKASKPFLDTINFSIEISELSYENESQEMELDWGFEVSNANQEKHELDFSYSNAFNRTVDEYEGTQTEDVTHDLSFEFDVNDLWKSLGYTSIYTLSQNLENDVYTTKYDGTISPLGVKAKVYSSEHIPKVIFSYLIGYSYLESDTDDEDDSGNPIKTISYERSIKHTIRLEFSLSFLGGDITIDNDFRYNKISPYDIENEYIRDYTYSNTLTINYALTQRVSFSFTNLYDYDDKRREEQSISAVQHRSSMSLAYNWSPE